MSVNTESPYKAIELKYKPGSFEEEFYKSKSKGPVPGGRVKAAEMGRDPKYRDDEEPYHIFYSNSAKKYVAIINTKKMTLDEGDSKLKHDFWEYERTMKRHFSLHKLPYIPRSSQWKFLEDMRLESIKRNAEINAAPKDNHSYNDTNIRIHYPVVLGVMPELYVKTVPSATTYADNLSKEGGPPYRVVYSKNQNNFIVITNVTEDRIEKGQPITKTLIDGLGEKIFQQAMKDITEMSANYPPNTTGGRRYRKARKASKSRKAHKSRKASKSRKSHRRH
jgi:hypothetical protein